MFKIRVLWEWKSIDLGGVRIECDCNKILPIVLAQKVINIAASRAVKHVCASCKAIRKFPIQVKVQMHKKSISV